MHSSGVELLQCLLSRNCDLIARLCLICKLLLFSVLNTGERVFIYMTQLFLYLCRRVTCNTIAIYCFPWCCSLSDSDFSFIFFGVSVHESHSDCVFTFKFIIVIIVIDVFYYYICIMCVTCRMDTQLSCMRQCMDTQR
jgi:hypothetical protein